MWFDTLVLVMGISSFMDTENFFSTLLALSVLVVAIASWFYTR